MQIVWDYAGVAVVVPMVVRPALDLFGHHCKRHLDDILARKHHRRPRAECIDTGCLPSPVENLERLSNWQFEHDILVALRLHRNWKAVHLWARLQDLFYPTRNMDTEAGVSHPPHSVSFVDWIVIPFQILAGSCFAPWVRYIASLDNYELNIPELHNTLMRHSVTPRLLSNPPQCHPTTPIVTQVPHHPVTLNVTLYPPIHPISLSSSCRAHCHPERSEGSRPLNLDASLHFCMKHYT
jgi:hypothetical protein